MAPFSFWRFRPSTTVPSLTVPDVTSRPLAGCTIKKFPCIAAAVLGDFSGHRLLEDANAASSVKLDTGIVAVKRLTRQVAGELRALVFAGDDLARAAPRTSDGLEEGFVTGCASAECTRHLRRGPQRQSLQTRRNWRENTGHSLTKRNRKLVSTFALEWLMLGFLWK